MHIDLPVVWLCTVPLLFKRGQYLQLVVLLQKGKPLWAGLVPLYDVWSLGPVTRVATVVVAGVGTAAGSTVVVLAK